MAFLLYLLVLLISLAGVGLNVLSLPGNWVMFLGAAGLCLWHDGHHPSAWVVGLILIVLLIAEGVEFLGGMLGARAFGASRAAAWAAIAGALVGGLIGIPPLAFLLGVDHLIGAVVGAFVAALVMEFILRRPIKEAIWGAAGAALGRGAGIVTKIGGGLIAWILLAIAAWPWW